MFSDAISCVCEVRRTKETDNKFSGKKKKKSAYRRVCASVKTACHTWQTGLFANAHSEVRSSSAACLTVKGSTDAGTRLSLFHALCTRHDWRLQRKWTCDNEVFKLIERLIFQQSWFLTCSNSFYQYLAVCFFEDHQN